MFWYYSFRKTLPKHRNNYKVIYITFVLKGRITESLKKFAQFYGYCFARCNMFLHTVSFFCELSLFVEAQTSSIMQIDVT